ncbi:MAG: KpsF/GutQ family sugar-phosphate isomerase [Candidatus Eisenbacteria bacterium]|uniref:KpsF/GutQ family sugar-phosphate isomerase n=1 Tax=Eiseniibacteriota bacterium TaxID=2212470 RepID=A0A933W1H1_UNCEI|nr:KpsF/GutQ family sugar-phosphate isomerase [Candidatus Eisenbacteria bacterium]
MVKRPIDLARAVVRTEAAAVAALEARIGPEFERAVELLAACRGKVIVSGVGKSGLIGQKLAATLTSTGTPAVFLHPSDAMHGDAGLFAKGEVALFISKSGATEELLALMPYLERLGLPLVAIVTQPGSPLAARANAALVLGPVTEACPLDLTPTTSITLTQVMGDCLAVALMEQRGFAAEDFRFLHPGGVIGHAAARRVGELMHAGAALPRVPESASLREVMLEIMNKRLGITTVVDASGVLAGVVTDGDFKRMLMKHSDPWGLKAADLSSPHPSTIAADALVASAVRVMEERPEGPITALVVVDDARRPLGVLHLHDCLRAR